MYACIFVLLYLHGRSSIPCDDVRMLSTVLKGRECAGVGRARGMHQAASRQEPNDLHKSSSIALANRARKRECRIRRRQSGQGDSDKIARDPAKFPLSQLAVADHGMACTSATHFPATTGMRPSQTRLVHILGCQIVEGMWPAIRQTL